MRTVFRQAARKQTTLNDTVMTQAAKHRRLTQAASTGRLHRPLSTGGLHRPLAQAAYTGR